MTMPRMTNTYMLPGPHAPGEIIASVDKGPLLPQLRRRPGRHHVGKFVFSASEAYLIENGRITRRSRAPR
jgi:TldD protein